MTVETNLVFSGEELGVEFIAETYKRGSKPTETFSGKRKFREIFKTEEEQKEALELVTKCKQWYSHKTPSEIKLSVEEYKVWRKLLEYCKQIA